MTKTTNHFSLEEWADFGRGRTAAEARARMEQHLEQGCAACARVLKLWNGVLEVAAREDAFEPPRDMVRCAKALFAAFPPATSPSLSVRVARLAGFRQPALEGVRGSEPGASHYLFKEGVLLLDMHLQPRVPSETVSMVGQVLDSTQVDRRFENRSVALMREKDAVARATTNEFGEFYLEFKPGEDLLLVIELEDKSYLVSHLPQPPKG